MSKKAVACDAAARDRRGDGDMRCASGPALRDNGDLNAGTTQLTLYGTLDDGRRVRAFAQVMVIGE
jgi:hypothetical protein